MNRTDRVNVRHTNTAIHAKHTHVHDIQTPMHSNTTPQCNPHTQGTNANGNKRQIEWISSKRRKWNNTWNLLKGSGQDTRPSHKHCNSCKTHTHALHSSACARRCTLSVHYLYTQLPPFNQIYTIVQNNKKMECAKSKRYDSNPHKMQSNTQSARHVEMRCITTSNLRTRQCSSYHTNKQTIIYTINWVKYILMTLVKTLYHQRQIQIHCHAMFLLPQHCTTRSRDVQACFCRHSVNPCP